MRWGFLLWFSANESQPWLHFRITRGALKKKIPTLRPWPRPVKQEPLGVGLRHRYFSKKLPRWSQSTAKIDHCFKNICFPPTMKADKGKFFHQLGWVRNDRVLFKHYLPNSSIHLSVLLSIFQPIHPSICSYKTFYQVPALCRAQCSFLEKTKFLPSKC